MRCNGIRSLSSFIERLIGWIDYQRAKALSRFNANARLRYLRKGRILILCYGNIYRSPFVEYYLNYIKPETLDLHIRSAGFHNKTGRSSAVDYIEHCKSWGVNLTDHRSSKVSTELLNWAELVIIMDGHNYKMLTQHEANVSTKIIWLGSLSDITPIEIADPYGHTPEQQQLVVQQLATASKALISRIRSTSA